MPNKRDCVDLLRAKRLQDEYSLTNLGDLYRICKDGRALPPVGIVQVYAYISGLEAKPEPGELKIEAVPLGLSDEELAKHMTP